MQRFVKPLLKSRKRRIRNDLREQRRAECRQECQMSLKTDGVVFAHPGRFRRSSCCAHEARPFRLRGAVLLNGCLQTVDQLGAPTRVKKFL